MGIWLVSMSLTDCTAITIGLQVTFSYGEFTSLESIHKSGMAGSYDLLYNNFLLVCSCGLLSSYLLSSPKFIYLPGHQLHWIGVHSYGLTLALLLPASPYLQLKPYFEGIIWTSATNWKG